MKPAHAGECRVICFPPFFSWQWRESSKAIECWMSRQWNGSHGQREFERGREAHFESGKLPFSRSRSWIADQSITLTYFSCSPTQPSPTPEVECGPRVGRGEREKELSRLWTLFASWRGFFLCGEWLSTSLRGNQSGNTLEKNRLLSGNPDIFKFYGPGKKLWC